MNAKKLYALVRAYKDIGLSHNAAFDRAFHEYKELMQRLKVRAA